MSSMPIATQPSLYRIHPASFRDGNGDGVGDAHGMLAALPYLKALSIDGLLLPQTLAPETEATVTGEGLTLWYADEVNRVRNAARAAVRPRRIGAGRDAVQRGEAGSGAACPPRLVGGQPVEHRRRRSAPSGQPLGQGDLRSAAAFLTLLAMLPAPICLYQGEELGLPHAAGLQDPRGAQTPMPWHEAPNRSPPAKSAGISRWRSNTARWPSAANSMTATPPYVTAGAVGPAPFAAHPARRTERGQPARRRGALTYYPSGSMP